MKCIECNKRMTKKIEKYHYVESGLDNVYINTYVYRCSKCKEIIVDIPKMDELNDLIGMAVFTKGTKLTGKEIKFLRKQMHFKANELAKYLSVTKQTISRWENDKVEISEYNDKLIRFVFVQMIQEECDKVLKEVLQRIMAITPIIKRETINIPHKKIKDLCDLPSLATI